MICLDTKSTWGDISYHDNESLARIINLYPTLKQKQQNEQKHPLY